MELPYWDLTQKYDSFWGKLTPTAYFYQASLDILLNSFLVKILKFINESNAKFMK